MSEIDGYQHRCLGVVTCPSRYIAGCWELGTDIALYRLDEDATDSVSFQAKRGDILLGGGSGEHPALRIAAPEAFSWLTDPEWLGLDLVESPQTLITAYWSMTAAFVLGDGYSRVGWRPTVALERWLAGHVIAYLAHVYPLDYAHLVGSEPPSEDGSICRLPSPDEQRL